MEARILIPSGLKIVTKEVKSNKQSAVSRLPVKTASETEDEKPSSSSGHFETSDQENQRRSSLYSGNFSYSDETKDEYDYKSECSDSSSSSSDSSDEEISDSRESSNSKFENVIGSSENSLSKKRSQAAKRRHKLGTVTQVKVHNNRLIEKALFTANEGDIHVMNLKGISSIPQNDEEKIFEGRMLISSSTEGGPLPLDLSKPRNLNPSRSSLTEPLKIGTPFDSPDSNDNDFKESRLKNSKQDLSLLSLHERKNTESSTMFFIRNVLKQSSPPSKLFQPYSLETESGRNKLNQRSLTPPCSNTTIASSLATPPSSIGFSSHSPVVRNSPVLRPILRTRGRERSLLPCEVCGKAFDRPSLLKRHLRTHTGEKPHICDVCSKGFSTSSSLNTHRRIHSGEKPHQCPICGKRFTASSNLYYHRMTHNKEKPHKCMLCGKSFPTPGDLKSHQYVHSGSWPYTCPVCHRGFSKQTNLRNHLLLHSGMSSTTSKLGDKPHTCQICDKKFALPCNLRAHLRTHEEDPISSCSVCKRSFLSSLNMLVNGRCRGCLLNNIPSNNSTNSVCLRRESSPSSGANSGESSKGHGTAMESSLIPHRISSSTLSTLPHPIPNNAMQLGSLIMPRIPGFSVPIPGSLSLPTSFHFPASSASTQSTTSAASLFRNSGASNATLASGTNPSSNPFLEQLFEWNYRFAKETAGSLSLSIMQQKLIESQVLAAQLMSVSANAPGFSVQDMLRIRPPEFSQLEAASENQFMQR